MPGMDILVVIDNAAKAARRLAPAAALAKRFDGRLTGFFATGLPAATSFGDLASGAQLVDAFMAAQRDEAVKAEAAFRQELGRLQLAGDWLCREADLTESIVETGRLYDLVVLGQTDPDGESLVPRILPEDLVLSLGRPILVIPYVGDFTQFDHVLIAWNGTREAARALHDAMFLIERADAVTVIEVEASGGRIVGQWVFDPEAGTIAWETSVARTRTRALEDAVAKMEAFIREDLGDARSFSLDSPKSRIPRIEALRKAASA